MNDMCSRIRERLASGESLSPDQVAHVAGCGPCAVLLRRFGLAERLLTTPDRTPPWLAEKTLARIRSRRLAKAFIREPFPWKWVVLGTALGAAALVFWTFVGIPGIDVPPPAANWVLEERHVTMLSRVVHAALPALAAVALSILPFLIPAKRTKSTA